MNPALKGENPNLTFREYLEWESKNETKHEYYAGEVFAMAGASENHNLVTGNLFASLHSHLRGNPCQAYVADMKLKVEFKHAESSYYPDMMVVCDKEDDAPLFKTRPQVIVEVMSDFRRDNIEKYMMYQSVPSLEEYLVIDQDPEQKRAWLYTRSSGWDMESIPQEGTVKLPSIGFSIPLEEVYAR